MKKSIKKACAFALLATSATALAGTSNVIFVDNTTNTSNNGVYAAQLQASAIKRFEIQNNGSTTVTVGDAFTVPTAKFWNGTTGYDATYIVTDNLGKEVEVDGGVFEVSKIGNYTITYSYTDSTLAEPVTYTTTYTVKGVIGTSTITVTENTQRTLPKYVYETYTGDIYIPTATVEFPNEEDEIDYNVTTKVFSPSSQELSFDNTTGKLTYTELEQGTYSVKFTATTTSGIYLGSKTVSFDVLSDKEFEDEYGKDYELKYEYSSTAPTSADIGQTITLPKPVGKMGTETVPVYSVETETQETTISKQEFVRLSAAERAKLNAEEGVYIFDECEVLSDKGCRFRRGKPVIHPVAVAAAVFFCTFPARVLFSINQ